VGGGPLANGLGCINKTHAFRTFSGMQTENNKQRTTKLSAHKWQAEIRVSPHTHTHTHRRRPE